MSEHNKDIDDIMHHYDSSNEAEKREMLEDLLHAEGDESGGFSEEADDLGLLGLVLFWAIGGFFIGNIIYNHFPAINSYFSGGFSETCGAWFLAVVAWSVVAFFCSVHSGFVVSLIILCLLAITNIIL